MSERDEGTPLTEAVRQIYAEVDLAFEGWLKEKGDLPVSCRKGCAGCCELLALATWPEALVIAEDLIERRLTDAFVPALTAQAALAMAHGEQRSYLAARVPCAFLQADRTCAVYAARPTACRYHVAFSPPALCHDRTPGTEILSADTVQVQAAALGPLMRQIVEQGPPEAAAQIFELAPLPVMVLAALRETGSLSALGGSHAVTPAEWVKRWGDRVYEGQHHSRRPYQGGAR